MPKYATKQRKTLLDYLSLHPDEDLSARQISQALTGEGVSLSAVYRNLADLEAEGKVFRSAREGSRDVFFRYTDLGECKRHLHLSCKQCGKTFHMPADATEALTREVAESAGFQLDRSSTVLYGVCENCRREKDGNS